MSTALVAPRDKMGRRGLVKCGLGSGSGLARVWLGSGSGFTLLARALHCWLGLYTAGSGFTLLAQAFAGPCGLGLLGYVVKARARSGPSNKNSLFG
jgi:hypothetical protein